MDTFHEVEQRKPHTALNTGFIPTIFEALEHTRELRENFQLINFNDQELLRLVRHHSPNPAQGSDVYRFLLLHLSDLNEQIDRAITDLARTANGKNLLTQREIATLINKSRRTVIRRLKPDTPSTDH